MIVAELPLLVNGILFTLLVLAGAVLLFLAVASIADPPQVPILGKVAFSVLLFALVGASIVGMIALNTVIQAQKNPSPDKSILIKRVKQVKEDVTSIASKELKFYTKHNHYTRAISPKTIWVNVSDNAQLAEIEKRAVFDGTSTQYFILLGANKTKLKDCINRTGLYEQAYGCNLNTGYWN